MADSNQSSGDFKVLGTFVGIIGLLGAALYFSGWIYRWVYYSYFNLEVGNLNLSSESFLFVPIQIFFGNITSFFVTFFAILLTFFLTKISLLFGTQLLSRRLWPFNNRLQNWLSLDSSLKTLSKEILIVGWCLFILFQVSSWGGTRDARRDAVDVTSKLPVVTLIIPQKYPLGLKIDEPFSPAEIDSKSYRAIGDIKRYTDLRDERESSDEIWRLLAEANGSFYIFSTISEKVPSRVRPVVLKVAESSAELLILTSESSAP